MHFRKELTNNPILFSIPNLFIVKAAQLLTSLVLNVTYFIYLIHNLARFYIGSFSICGLCEMSL